MWPPLGFEDDCERTPQEIRFHEAMNVFLSYSSNEAAFAEQLAHRLDNERHSTFFDRHSLVPGEGYDEHIRDAVERCDLFVFLISPDSLSAGSYALTELDIARRRWPRAAGHVLPVAMEEVDHERLPAYLAAVTVLHPAGDPIADIVAAVGRLQRQRRGRQAAIALAGTGMIAIAGLIWWRAEPLPTSTERPAAVPMSRTPVKESVKLIGMLGNTGWLLTFNIVSPEPVKEIFYRWTDEATFRSTGFHQVLSQQTGLPLPRQQIEMPVSAIAPSAPRDLLLKYTDASDVMHGPFTLGFDPQAQVVAWTQQVLDQTAGPWVSFREYPAGHRLLYFTHLLSYKNGLREIRFSVDDGSLARRVRFEPDWSGPGAPRLADGDQQYVEIPMSAKFVEVQLVFADGTQSPRRRFDVRSS